MLAVTTRSGRRIEIISQSELRDPLPAGIYVRAYCHIHHSDHQRSLSINRKTGWGRCFNAACQAVVLVEEWNPRVAANMTHRSLQSTLFVPAQRPPSLPEKPPLARQPVLIFPPKETPQIGRAHV